MSRAVTVSPVYQEGPNGEQSVVDFSFDSQEPYDSSNERYGGNVNDVYEDEYGNTHHLFEDVELQEEYDGSYNNDEHVAAIHEAYPDLASAIQWASQNPEIIDIDAYNDAMDADNHSAMYEQIERLLNVFYEYAEFEEEDAYEAEDEEYESPVDEAEMQEFVQGVYEHLGGQAEYENLISWAAENLDQDLIQHYDTIMDSDNIKMISDAVGWLIQYREDNY